MSKSAVVTEDRAAVGTEDLVLCPNKNLVTGLRHFLLYFSDITSLEQDVLTVSSAIYACDLAFKRGERENITRSIHLTIPVVNLQAFERSKEDLEVILWILSHDNWTLRFVQCPGSPESPRDWPQSTGKTLLFSGGLDSLAAAVDLIDSDGLSSIQLASHFTSNQATQLSQKSLAEYLTEHYGTGVKRVAIRTGGRNANNLPFPSDAAREGTQRTRSFMFLAIAALAARRSGQNELVIIAENGQMAIHLPLSAGRIGAFSTHTAHPQFIAELAQYFTQLLSYELLITNPYLYKTKAEVVRELTLNHQSAVPSSISCWKSARVIGHCGECIPCYIRRIALEFNGLKLSEYTRDIFSENVRKLGDTDEGKRNLMELTEFVYTFNTFSDAELEIMYPEVFNEYFDRQLVVQMYRRFSIEAIQVLSNYPYVAELMAH